jgi:hypothetical protein
LDFPKRFLSIVIHTTDKKQNVVAYINVSINNTYKPLKSAPIGDSLDISNGHVFYIWIEYISQSKNFSAFINNTNNKPQHLVLFGTMDLSVFFFKLLNPLFILSRMYARSQAHASAHTTH